MIAVRPPEYWPRPEYFALMDAADCFVLADTFQYSRQSFQNRTALRTPDGRQWISIPLRGRQHGKPIFQVEIRGKHRWIGKHWRALHFNYRTTPFFEFYEPRLRPLFDADWRMLSDLTTASIEHTREMLGIATPLVRASQLAGAPSSLGGVFAALDKQDLPSTASAGSGLLVPSESLAVDASFASAVLDFHPLPYRQNFAGFEKGMAALDLLFNYGPEALSIIRRQAKVRGQGVAK